MESAKGVSKNKNLQERCISFALMSLVDFLISISFEVSQPKEEKVMTNNNQVANDGRNQILSFHRV